MLRTPPQSIEEIEGLASEEEKIVALDPDFIGWKFPKESIESIKNVKAICLQTTSFSWIDTAFAASKNIPVTNLRGFSAEAVAEFGFMLMLGAARKLSIVMKDGFKEDFVKHQGIELKGKTVGVIGLGRIGKRFAELAQGFGMNVVYWSKNSKDNRFKEMELKDVLQSDVVFPALAQNDETSRLITDDLLKNLKPTVIFVSIVHKIFNHELLLSLAKEGKIFGYAFEEEGGSPLKYEGNVFALPSLAWTTEESMRANAEMWVESIEKAVNGEFPTRVN